MSDIFVPPTKQQMTHTLGLYGDPIVFWGVNALISNLGKINSSQESYSLKEYYRQTRLMILNFGIEKTLNIFCQSVEDIATENYSNLDVPNMIKQIQKGIDPFAKNLAGKLKITEVAEHYGLKVHGSKAVCPFHDDKDPSLSFSDQKGLFHCFGCHVKGDLVTFVRLMEELKHDSD